MGASNGQLRRYRDAVAIVTGGASGIGRALAEELAARGARVTVADRQGDLAEEVAEAIRRQGGAAGARAVDVRDAEAVRSLVDDTAEQGGRLDYIFNNAGIGIGGEVHLHSLEDWNRIIDVNLRGVVHGIHAAYPRMRSQGFGHIVSTASMAGLFSGPGMASYAATKHAVVGLSKALRAEAAASGVRVSVLCPGVIRTPILTGGRYGRVLQPIPEELQHQFYERWRPMEPRRFAARALDRVARNQAIVIVPAWWRIFWWIERASPALSFWLARRVFQRGLERLYEAGASSGAGAGGGTA